MAWVRANSIRGRFREVHGEQFHLAVADTAQASPVFIRGGVFTVAFHKDECGVYPFADQIILDGLGTLVGKPIVEFCTRYPIGVTIQQNPFNAGIGVKVSSHPIEHAFGGFG